MQERGIQVFNAFNGPERRFCRTSGNFTGDVKMQPRHCPPRFPQRVKRQPATWLLLQEKFRQIKQCRLKVRYNFLWLCAMMKYVCLQVLRSSIQNLPLILLLSTSCQSHLRSDFAPILDLPKDLASCEMVSRSIVNFNLARNYYRVHGHKRT